MFSFDDYREIIRIIKATGRHANYADALGKDRFIIMRHDVEYSVERAYELARVEQSMDFVSTYFFQWTNNSYNILSKRNMDMIKDMHERGQHIGLHFALNGMTDMSEIRKRIRKEIEILSEMFGFAIREFSIHRPSKDVLRENIKLVVMFAVTLVILLILSPMVTAILILTFLLMFLLPATIGRCLEKRQDRVSAQMAAFTEKLKDILSGYEVLRSYDRIEAAKYRFQEENEEEIRVRFRAARLFALNEGLSDTLAVLSTITVIFVSAYLVLIGQITMGTLLALVQLSSSFMAPVMLLMQNVPRIQSMKAVIARLNSYAEDDPAVKPLPLELPSFEKGIELDGASFSYDGEQTVLADITMRIDKGGKYAVMGPSGCGKTTLIKLLLGYFEDYGGSIRYDGRELRALDMDKIAGIISVIHQNVYLFNLSVRENILLFEEFDEAALAEAVEKSGVSLFIDEKEGGLDHGAGENGALLSGGQRQRVALARALIRRAPFVILDEGTSALDRKTACEIESRLLEDEELTLLTITHNPDPQLMRRYDGIYRMNDGRLENCTKTFYTE